MNCKNCNNNVSKDDKFCGKCGTEQSNPQSQKEDAKEEQKSFKLDMSKEGNRRGLMGICFLIGLKILGPLVGSFLIAGIILGVLFVIIDYSFKK